MRKDEKRPATAGEPMEVDDSNAGTDRSSVQMEKWREGGNRMDDKYCCLEQEQLVVLHFSTTSPILPDGIADTWLVL